MGFIFFFFQAEDGIRDLVRSRGLGDVYKRQKLYVPVGAPCNICLKENVDARYASITRMNADGSDFEVFAKGIRNTVGFDWHPVTNELWFTDNGRDNLGDNIPPDELNCVPTSGLHFGYPFLHGKNILDPEFGLQGDTTLYTIPKQELGPHVAALGAVSYTHLRAHETVLDLVCRLLLEKKQTPISNTHSTITFISQ